MKWSNAYARGCDGAAPLDNNRQRRGFLTAYG